MIDVDHLLLTIDKQYVLNILGIENERRRNSRGYEIYFKCVNPDHEDKSPSASMAEIGKYAGLFNCWVCHDHGNLIHIVQRILKKSFVDALSWLSTMVTSSELTTTKALMLNLDKLKPERKKHDIAIAEICAQLPANYAPCGFSHMVALDAERYLISRRISLETQRTYMCGATEHYQIGRCGIIPIYMYEKIVSLFFFETKRGGAKRYPKGSPMNDMLFNYDNAIKTNTCIIVESILDVLQMHTLGFSSGVSCFTNRLSETQCELIKKFDRIIVYPDLDGLPGWHLVTQCVKEFGKSIEIAFPPTGYDPGDCDEVQMAKSLNSIIKYSDYESDYIFRSKDQEFKVLEIKK